MLLLCNNFHSLSNNSNFKPNTRQLSNLNITINVIQLFVHADLIQIKAQPT